MYTNCQIPNFLLVFFSPFLLFQFPFFLSIVSEFPYHLSIFGIFDIKICDKYIFSYVILCTKGFETGKCRQVNSFITFVNTYSGNYGNRKKNVPLVKNKTKIYEKYLRRLLFYKLSYEILLWNFTIFAKYKVRKCTWRKFLHRRFFVRDFTSFCKAIKFESFTTWHGLKFHCIHILFSRHKNLQGKKKYKQKISKFKTLQFQFFNYIYAFTWKLHSQIQMLETQFRFELWLFNSFNWNSVYSVEFLKPSDNLPHECRWKLWFRLEAMNSGLLIKERLVEKYSDEWSVCWFLRHYFIHMNTRDVSNSVGW